jgi:hypothetical protein
MVLLIIFISVIYSSINDFYIGESNSLIDYTIDPPVKFNKKIDIKSLLNTINRSIPNINDVNKANQVKSLFIQYNQ